MENLQQYYDRLAHEECEHSGERPLGVDYLDEITAKELHWEFDRPISSVYRLMAQCSTRRLVSDGYNGTQYVVSRDEFVRLMTSKRRGNPNFGKKRSSI